VAFALEGCTGWRYVVEEMHKAGVHPHLAEPADTAALRGPKRRAKTDKADAKHLRELLDAGRLPECYIPPERVLEWRATLELYSDLRVAHTEWAQRVHATCFHQGTTALGQAGVVRASRERLTRIVSEQLSPAGRLQVNTALSVMDALDEHLGRLRQRIVATARVPCQNAVPGRDLPLCGCDQAAWWYSLRTPPRTRCRRMAASIDTTTPGSWSGGR
jgi:transposase